MDAEHPLKALLQLQLGSDSYAVVHLPYILASLTAESLAPSPHSSKWTARINSLLHSKAPDARWAGLCIAHKTSVLSKSTMIECAHSWIGIALPVLSKKEATPILSASVRLLRVLFTAATDVPEFQRQVATPNVAKFTAALIQLGEKHADVEFKTSILSTLALIIPLYPTLHKASHSALSTLCLGLLNGSPFKPPNAALRSAASRLYAILHFTGGKVGAANLWRKAVDETLAFGWTSFLSLRSTFLVDGRVPQLPSGTATQEPLLAIPLNVDRLRCSILALCDLLKTTTHRPVQVPLGALTKFVIALLSCTTNDKVDRHIDPGVRAMEAAVTPEIWKSACELISCLANCVHHHLSSSLTRIASCIAFHLEQPLTASERLPFLTTLHAVLTNCHPIHAPVLATRLGKALLPLLSVVLAKQADARDETDAPGRSKKSKKRAREYEGDEVFRIAREVVCATPTEGDALLAAFAVLRLVLRNPHLSPAVHSIASRVTLSILLALPQMAPASLSPDPAFHPLLLQRVQALSTELSAGSPGDMSRSLGLVLNATLRDVHQAYTGIELLLHPRLPPLVRAMPPIEALSLFRAEESQEESDTARALGIVGAEIDDGSPIPDVLMTEPPPPPKVVKMPDVVMAPPPKTVTPAASLVPQPLPQQSPRTLPPDTEASVRIPRETAPTKAVHEEYKTPVFVPEEEKNEEMPAIDLGSDSEEEA
ncbi:rRNA processing/ribosome biogenesis-domain-containing protein [Mycena vulgaris]|nr:rRNA processing/ribosome biogenesis-domain-containing protein [Mycena vulgaris]